MAVLNSTSESCSPFSSWCWRRQWQKAPSWQWFILMIKDGTATVTGWIAHDCQSLDSESDSATTPLPIMTLSVSEPAQNIRNDEINKASNCVCSKPFFYISIITIITCGHRDMIWAMVKDYACTCRVNFAYMTYVMDMDRNNLNNNTI